MASRNDQSPNESINAAQSANVSSVRIELGNPTLAVIVVLVGLLGACGVAMGLNLAKQAQQDDDFKSMKTQQWLLERRLMDREALDIVNGIKKPGDDAWGATGNIQRMKPKDK